MTCDVSGSGKCLLTDAVAYIIVVAGFLLNQQPEQLWY